jgi:hypothetical protein
MGGFGTMFGPTILLCGFLTDRQRLAGSENPEASAAESR